MSAVKDCDPCRALLLFLHDLLVFCDNQKLDIDYSIYIPLVCLLQERPAPTEEEQEQESSLKQNFKKIAGADMEIDAYELQEVLNAVFQRGKCCTLNNLTF